MIIFWLTAASHWLPTTNDSSRDFSRNQSILPSPYSQLRFYFQLNLKTFLNWILFYLFLQQAVNEGCRSYCHQTHTDQKRHFPLLSQLSMLHICMALKISSASSTQITWRQYLQVFIHFDYNLHTTINNFSLLAHENAPSSLQD